MGYVVNADLHREVEWNADQTRIVKKNSYKRGDKIEVPEHRVESLLAQGAIVEEADYDEDVRRPEVEEVSGAGSTPPAPQDLLSTPGESAEGDSSDSDAEDDEYSDMTVDELKAELGERDLPTSGNKAELQARLREDDAAE